jgi:hypothetical protein
MELAFELREQGQAESPEREALPDLNPWREVGWIFRDGACVAIERRGETTRAREMAD